MPTLAFPLFAGIHDAKVHVRPTTKERIAEGLLPDESIDPDAAVALQRCRRRIAVLQKRALTPDIDLWVLPPHSQRYLVHSMVEGKDRSLFLAVGAYRGHHRHLHAGLELTFEMEELGDFRYRALGEIILRNDHDFATAGEIVAVNEMAYFYKSVVAPQKLGENDAFDVERSMRRHLWRGIAETVHVLDYRRSMLTGLRHWAPGLDDLIHELDHLKELGIVGPDENYRHYIGLRVATFSLQLQRAMGEDGDRAPRIRFLEESLHHELTLESIDYYLRCLKNDGIDIPELDRLIKLLETFRLVGLTVEQWAQMDHDFQELIVYMRPRNEEAHLVASVQIIRIR